MKAEWRLKRFQTVANAPKMLLKPSPYFKGMRLIRLFAYQRRREWAHLL